MDTLSKGVRIDCFPLHFEINIEIDRHPPREVVLRVELDAILTIIKRCESALSKQVKEFAELLYNNANLHIALNKLSGE